MVTDTAKIIQRNFAEKAALAVRHRKDMNIVKTENFVRVDSGLPADTFNVSVVLNDNADYNSLLEDTVEYFNKMQYPMALWCWDYLVGFKAFLDNSRLVLGETNIGMAAHTNTLKPNVEMPRNFCIKQAEDSGEVKEFGNIIETLFGESMEGKNIKLYYDDLAESQRFMNSPIKMYIGYLDGKAVCTGSASFNEESAGIYDIATLPDYRNRGLGTAMFHYILSGIKKSHHGLCVLQASQDGIGIYEKAGFEPVCSVYVYENRNLIDNGISMEYNAL